MDKLALVEKNGVVHIMIDTIPYEKYVVSCGAPVHMTTKCKVFNGTIEDVTCQECKEGDYANI